MSEGKIARVYATALYQAAREEGRVEQVRRDLGEFVQAMGSSPELRQLLVAEEIADVRKTQVLLELTEGGDELMRNLLRLMVDKKRESELAGVFRAFVHLVEEAEGLVHVEVVSAVPLTAPLQDALRTKIEQSLQKTVELTLTVDKEILGGLRLRIGDRVADASVRHRLERLRALLITPMASLEGSVEAAS
ncbi:MAG: ATP synthase F1 subunit delta [Actinobacteria bacterium RBG_16_64_13]|nr:MAG: ATP synthase F1 subunit delta [Actinobacteria bacterium RBG_16_64_13]